MAGDKIYSEVGKPNLKMLRTLNLTIFPGLFGRKLSEKWQIFNFEYFG